ncbi:MAG: hypothetical protein FWE70_08245, partial [Oscillospiraceae bacterium]|nr:hypothetical protein [Oscillospiraceae bacterium]
PDGAGTEALAVGDRVSHGKFGQGTVTKVEGAGDDQRLEITFGAYGMKRLMAQFANLKKADG